MLKATIFDIQRGSFVDGPGIRTTVFFKGCNLKCKWCHNPESQASNTEILFYKEKCTGCGRCANITADSANFICLDGAKEICGKEYTVSEVLSVLLKDKAFFESSGGGVTFSGGECMLQIDFLSEILKKCKENGIQTAVDTAGNIPWEFFERILKYTDLFLYDIKLFDEKKHKQYTGSDNKIILENLKNLFASGAKVIIRIPVIATVNDSAEEMEKIKDLLSPYSPEKIELLPYHNIGEYKYNALNKIAPKFSAPNKAVIEKLYDIFKAK